MRLRRKHPVESQTCVCAAACGLSGLATRVESDSADLEAELSPRKMLFCFSSGSVEFSTKLILPLNSSILFFAYS